MLLSAIFILQGIVFLQFVRDHMKQFDKTNTLLIDEDITQHFLLFVVRRYHDLLTSGQVVV